MAPKRCPYCGRLNTSSDLSCYHCENPLGPEVDHGDILLEERVFKEELEEGLGPPLANKTPVPRRRPLPASRKREPSLMQLWVACLARKVFYLCLSLGGFFLMALLAIWFTYDNFAVAMIVVGIFSLSVFFSLFYPDIMLSTRYGRKMVAASFIANLFLLGTALPLLLLYLRKKGYISGVGFLILPLAGGVAIILMTGMLLSWWASKRSRG